MKYYNIAFCTVACISYPCNKWKALSFQRMVNMTDIEKRKVFDKVSTILCNWEYTNYDIMGVYRYETKNNRYFCHMSILGDVIKLRICLLANNGTYPNNKRDLFMRYFKITDVGQKKLFIFLGTFSRLFKIMLDEKII